MAVVAALAAGSVALLGFGIDSFVECVSGGVMIWRLRAEQAGASEQKLEQTEYTARKCVAAALALLASYVVIDAVGTLWKREHPRPSPVGIALTALSLGVMWWLAREKRRVAAAIASRAMEADAFQTTACWWLSLAALVGMALTAPSGCGGRTPSLGSWWRCSWRARPAAPGAATIAAETVPRKKKSAPACKDFKSRKSAPVTR